jgi:hypothetical protein
MKKAILLVSICTSLHSFSQSYKLDWGEEMKFRKGTSDMDIISADNAGLYFLQARLSKGFVGYSTAYKLFKFDKNFSEVFEKDYKKDLKGLEFNSIQPLENDLFMFATDFIKKEKTLQIFGAKIDKGSGDVVGDLTELANYQMESKKDNFQVKMTPIDGGKSFLMVSNISAKSGNVSLGVNVLDKSFKKSQSTIINLSYSTAAFTLEDVQYTKDKKIILLGKQYEEIPVGKKNRTRLVFKQYRMLVYNPRGVKEKDIVLEAGDKFVLSGQLIQQADGGLLLAGFYSNTSKKETLSGFFINKIDYLTGQIAVNSFKEISPEMLGKNFDNSDNDEGGKKKEAPAADEDSDDFPNDFIIRNVQINPVDQSIIITSENSQYSVRSYTSSSYNSITKTWDRTTYTIHTFTNRDILVIKADKTGQIQWLNAIPKSQVEEIQKSVQGTSGFTFGTSMDRYFATAGGMPYYSSYISMLANNKLIIFMNDHSSNNVNPAYGDKIKELYKFKKSTFYGVSIDLESGKMTRKRIADNTTEDILVPRHAYVVNNEVFIPSWRMHLLAKAELRFAKLSVK